MAEIVIKDLTFTYEDVYDYIFENVNIVLDTNWRLGFIGRNGKGKTTFLKLLLGQFTYKGTIQSNVEFEYFPYQLKDDNKKTLEVAKSIIAPFTKWEKQMEELLVDGSKESLQLYGEILAKYEQSDGYIIDSKIEKELGKLKVELDVLSRPFYTLSHGERTKVLLASLFLKKNQFLLIDEPTNHLDSEGREVLANYLKGKKGFILVSHDRSFLDACIDHVLSINRTTIEIQKGNYTSWKENKEKKDKYEIEKNKILKKDISRLDTSMKRTKGWSDKVEASKIGSHVGDRGFVGAQAARMMKRAKAVENRIEKQMEEKKTLLKDIEETIPLKINQLDYKKERLIFVDHISFFYNNTNLGTKENQFLLNDITFEVNKGDRLGIKGGNGSGKSTLIQLLLQKLQPTKGSISIGSGVACSYISQDTSWLKGNLEDFVAKYQLDKTLFYTILRQLDFSREQLEKKIETFSGGQKKKVLIAKSLLEPSHIFIWDEPLNYIDIFSRVQIEELILQYQPTMIFIEHDSYFYEKIKTKEIVLK